MSTFWKRLFIEEPNALFRRENDIGSVCNRSDQDLCPRREVRLQTGPTDCASFHNICLRRRHCAIPSPFRFVQPLQGWPYGSLSPRVALASLTDPGLLSCTPLAYRIRSCCGALALSPPIESNPVGVYWNWGYEHFSTSRTKRPNSRGQAPDRALFRSRWVDSSGYPARKGVLVRSRSCSTVFEVAWASCPWFTGETPVPLRALSHQGVPGRASARSQGYNSIVIVRRQS